MLLKSFRFCYSPRHSRVSTLHTDPNTRRVLLFELIEIVNGSSPAQMQRPVPIISFEGKKIDYGKMEVPGHGTFWGPDGTVWVPERCP